MTIPDQNPLGYMGLKERTPPNVRHFKKDPTTHDYIGFNIGDFWVNKITKVSFQLLSKAKDPVTHLVVAQWLPAAGGGVQVKDLQPDVGVAVVPLAGTITVNGTNGILTNNGGANTLEVFNDCTVTGDDATANVFVGGNINIVDTNNLITSAAGVSTLGVGIDPPVTIANGGTNAVAMGTNTGIVKFDGTSLVTSATALLSAGNVYTNTSQISFFAYPSGAQNNCTGDATIAQVLLGSVLQNVGSAFNVATSTFTVPINGTYLFTAGVYIGSGLAVGHTYGASYMLINGAQTYLLAGNFAAMRDSNSDALGVTGCITRYLTLGETVTLHLFVSGGAKTVNINNTAYRTFLAGTLLC